MNGQIDRVRFSLSSTADFEDREFASGVIGIFLSLPETVRPKVFGAFKPLKRRVGSPEEIVDVLTNERGPKVGLRGGSLLLGEDDVGYSVQWNKSQRPQFAFLGGSLAISALAENERILDDWLEGVGSFVRFLNPSYGEVRSMEAGIGVPRDLVRGLPDVPAISIYGEEYVGLFGSEKIENAPFLQIENLGDCYWLSAQRELRLPVPAEMRSRIRSHFGEETFVCDLHTQRKNSRAPKFDLSNSLC
jgi:hypothetical protein